MALLTGPHTSNEYLKKLKKDTPYSMAMLHCNIACRTIEAQKVRPTKRLPNGTEYGSSGKL